MGQAAVHLNTVPDATVYFRLPIALKWRKLKNTMPTKKTASQTGWKVYKFGGASVQDAGGILNAAQLVQNAGSRNLLVVISAMGKTTVALDKVLRLAWAGDATEARRALDEIEAFHRAVAVELGIAVPPFPPEKEAVRPDEQGHKSLTLKAMTLLQEEFDQIRASILKREQELARREKSASSEGERQWAASALEPGFDRFYDGIVHRGEVMSTLLAAAAFENAGMSVEWHDARRLVFTDATHREARINWALTRKAIRTALLQGSATVHLVQGFIGISPEGHPVTLGLEGSDFSAGIFADALSAESVTLWKNVPGVFSADPALFPDAQRLPQLSYREVFQMANYGAKVIHPKTLSPLEHAGIPLRVRSFSDPAAAGSDIGAEDPEAAYPPIRVRLDGLLLISLQLQDLGYLGEDHIQQIFSTLGRYRAKAYLTEIGLMNISVAVIMEEGRKDALLDELGMGYRIRYNEELSLLSIRHYNDQIVKEIHALYQPILELRNRQTLQCLYTAEQR